MGEDTFRIGAPEFTIRQMVVLVAIVAFVASMAGWVFLESPFKTGPLVHIFLMVYLYQVRKATYRAIVIACEPAGAVITFVLACFHLSTYLSKGLPGELVNAFLATFVSVSTTVLVIFHVRSLPKKWETPVRHVYPN